MYNAGHPGECGKGGWTGWGPTKLTSCMHSGPFRVVLQGAAYGVVFYA
jgi:hypothetical protein